jgi:hypothetical protein
MKNESVIVKEICYHGNEYSDAPNTVVLSFNANSVDRIAHVMSLLEHNKEKLIINSIRIDACPYSLWLEYDKDNSETENIDAADWRDDGGQFIITSYGIYFYSQSKWDASDQIKSDSISFEEIMEGFKEDLIPAIGN